MQRWAKSYSIVDHELLHGRYFHQLSLGALALYLFLIVVSDKNGKSFYADATITEILRLKPNQLEEAREELITLQLIDYRRPYWWIQNIPQKKEEKKEELKTEKISAGENGGPFHERSQREDPILKRCPQPVLSPDPASVGDIAQKGLENLRRILFP